MSLAHKLAVTVGSALTRLRRPPASARVDRVETILVGTWGGLGDAVLQAQLLRALRQAWPGASITAIVDDVAPADVRELWPEVDEVLVRPTGGWLRIPRTVAMALGIRRRSHDLALAAGHCQPHAPCLLVALSGAAVTVGEDKDGRGWLFRAATPYADTAHVLDANARLLQAIGLAPAPEPFRLAPPDRAHEAADRLCEQEGLDAGRFCCIHPGSGRLTPFKMWPSERFARVADALARERGLPVVLLAGEHERDVALATQSHMREPARVATEAPLLAVAGLLERARLVVGNDSGLIHLSDALGTPTVSIWGPGDLLWYGPRSAHHVAVHSDRECLGCLHRHRFVTEFDCPDPCCLREVSVEQVLDAVGRVL